MDIRFVVLVHDDRKLFYVCTHKSDTKTILGWKNVASKARSMYEKHSHHHNPDGATIAMVNTNYSGWRDVYLKDEYDKESGEYVDQKVRIIQHWESAGYTNVGVRLRASHGAGLGLKEMGWNRKFNVLTMTKEKIYGKIELIERSLDDTVPNSIVHLAYREVVSIHPTVSYNVDDMLSLLRFVREKMGMDMEEHRVAA